MSHLYLSLEIKEFLEILRLHRDANLYSDILSYPTLIEDVYYVEMARDYALVDWNNCPEDINLKNNYRNLCEKHKNLSEKKNIVFDKLVRLMATF
jgi:hypothetical protein